MLLTVNCFCTTLRLTATNGELRAEIQQVKDAAAAAEQQATQQRKSDREEHDRYMEIRLKQHEDQEERVTNLLVAQADRDRRELATKLNAAHKSEMAAWLTY